MLPDNKTIIFDTTMRDGELTPGVKMTLQDKISISKLLEEMGVDIIEVGYPGHSQKDFDDVEWSAFDATRSEPDFLCKAIETAIKSGATTVSIPDSLGLVSSEKFAQLIQVIV